MSPDPAEILRDPARLAALCETRLPDTPPEEAFDRLTRLAARLLGAPGSTVSLVDGERQFFKSHLGLPAPLAEARQTPIDESICAHVVMGGAPLVVGDTAADPRFREHPAWLRWGVRAYAGVPVATADGQVLGTLCVVDVVPRAWGDEDVAALAELGALAAAEVERRRAETRAARTTAVLRETEAWFRSLVEQTIAGIYVIQDGRFRYVNPRFAEAFGMRQEDFYAPGALLRVVHPDDVARVEENIRRRLEGELLTLRYAFRGIRADGRELFLEVHGSRAEMEGRPALVGIGIDVTERVLAEREREAAVAARDRFYAMASHELRTPISTVMLYNDLLLSGVCGELTEAQRESVERSQKSARHLLELINDLLDLSKLEAGKMEARIEDVELVTVVESVAGDVEPLAAEHGCGLSLSVARRPLPVAGDERRIRQILLNLLSNAVKFGRGRPIEVWCGPEGEGVVVSVTDHGPGIAPGDLPRIFEDFVQLGDESEVGTGLGLPIARRLAALLGGRLEVSSSPGVGSTFRLFLPHLLEEGASGEGSGIPEVIY
ncbi:MAG TPA: ATP-binding protein [Longimicrobium sp.]|nr:ATP-binding protein [Longimicrobium sp.]